MASTRPSCRLPPELVLEILSECTPASLLACSLVCREWLLTCRPRLFEDRPLKISRISQCDDFLALLDTGTKSTLLNYLSSLHLVISGGEWHLAGHRNHPRLTGERQDRGFYGYVHYILELAHRLKNQTTLEHLSIKSMPTAPTDYDPHPLNEDGVLYPDFDLKPVTKTLFNITSLHISLSLPEDVSDMITFICSFPSFYSTPGCSAFDKVDAFLV
ncbi:hypothetical protein AAF712_003883 [Marasmius tenuissimus]|uniref:F-box domain-containing protein n=1 Tax=Marasmius tenuissimus TaxID=585030 RepID=A0ABR3A5S0_9AGAR